MRVLPLLALSLRLPAAVGAQDAPPVIRSDVNLISIRDGETLRRGGWTLAPEVRPDVYEAELENGKPRRGGFWSRCRRCTRW